MVLPAYPAASTFRNVQQGFGRLAGVKRISSPGKQMSMLIQA